jgi:large subunit ribosomal protein L25
MIYMADFTFAVEERTEFGKGVARRFRAAGKIPAVIYGGGKVPFHITLPEHETTQAVRLPNALFDIQLNSQQHLALVKDIQRDFVTRNIEHIDLYEVESDTLVDVRVELRIVGETKPGTASSVSFKSIVIKTKASEIPRYIELDIDGADDGEHFTISDIKLPAGVTTALRPDLVVVAVKARAARKDKQVDQPGGGEEANQAASS